MPFALYTAAETPNALQWAIKPWKRPFLWEDLNPHLIHGSLGPHKASRSVQPFLQVSQTWPTDRQSDRQTMLLNL